MSLAARESCVTWTRSCAPQGDARPAEAVVSPHAVRLPPHMLLTLCLGKGEMSDCIFHLHGLQDPEGFASQIMAKKGTVL